MTRNTKLDSSRLPPGYDPAQPILPYIAGKKLFCPIPGCNHKGAINRDRFTKHIKLDHSRCFDFSKVRIYEPKLIYDIQNQLFVCLEHSTVRLKNGNFCEDPGFAANGTPIENSDGSLKCLNSEPIAERLTDGKEIMGLPILSGYHCIMCGIVENSDHRCGNSTALVKCKYQKVRAFKGQHFRLHRIGESIRYIAKEIPREDPPVYEERYYLHRHEFLWRHFDFEDHPVIMKVIGADKTRICQALFELYFYEQYLTLDSDRFVGFRKTLSHDLHESEPFGTLSDKTAVIRYAELFGHFGVLLLRNRVFRVKYGVSPLGDRAANHMFYVWKQITESPLCFKPLVKTLNRIKKRLRVVQNSINELDRRFASNTLELSNIIVQTKEDILADAKVNPDVVHRLMVNLLLENGDDSYTLFQACGYYLRYSQKEQLDGVQAPRFTSAIMFAMKLTCWAQLMRNHNLGYSLWTYSLESTQEFGRLFYSLCHDVQVYADTTRLVSCTWVKHGEVLAIEGKCIELDQIRSGFARMIQDLQVELRMLTFNKETDCIVPEDVTERSHGFSPFPRKVHLDIDIDDLPPHYIDMGQNFLKKLMILVRLCCLGAPRQTEVAMWTYRNTHIFRSIRLLEQVIRIRSDYHKNKYLKGRSISSKALTFLYVLPSDVSKLLVVYLVYVRPLELKLLRYQLDKSKQARTGVSNLASHDKSDLDDGPVFEYESDGEAYQNMEELEYEDEMDDAEFEEFLNKENPMLYTETEDVYKQKSKHGRMMEYYLCHGPDGFWPDYFLYRRHYTLTNKYFGTGLAFNEWRHIFELVNVLFVEDEASSEIKSMLSKACGHTELTAAMNYGVDGERSIDITVADTIKYEFLSKLYHNFFGLNSEIRYFSRVREEDHKDMGGDLEPSLSQIQKVANFNFSPGEMRITALMIAGYSFIAVFDDVLKKLTINTYDCNSMSDFDIDDMKCSWRPVLITNAHSLIQKPRVIRGLQRMTENHQGFVLVSPLIPNYMLDKYNHAIGMKLSYTRQEVCFDETVFYKMFTQKLRLLYIFGHLVRNANRADGAIVMYCHDAARKFFQAVVPFGRKDLVVFLDANNEETKPAAPKVQLVVHCGSLLSYMLTMNQVRTQKTRTSLWLGYLDNQLNEEIDTDNDVSLHYLMHNGCLRLYHQNHFRGMGKTCRHWEDVTKHCSNCRATTDPQWKGLVLPEYFDFDVKLWLLEMLSSCLCESDPCKMDNKCWRESIHIPRGYCPECGVCSTDVFGQIREDHAVFCRVRYVMRDAIMLCLEKFNSDWDDEDESMGKALQHRGVHKRGVDHQWENYYMMKEKQVVVLAVEYLYFKYFYMKLTF